MNPEPHPVSSPSKAVDVLAVFDREIARAGGVHFSDGRDLIEARAAVAELLAADREYDAAKARRIQADNRITSGDRSDDAFREKASAHHAYDRAVDRRRAALQANCGEAG